MRLLQQQNSYPQNRFQLSLHALSLRLIWAEPRLRIERELRMDFSKAMGFSYGDEQTICHSEQYDTRLDRLFRYDLLTTLLYWTLMQSACKAFAEKPHLVAVYLQSLRYIIDYHLESCGRSCYCWVRATTNSMSALHDALGPCENLRWEHVKEKIVMPLARCALSIRRAKVGLQSSSDLEDTDSLSILMQKLYTLELGSVSAAKCDFCSTDISNNSVLSDESRSLHEHLRSPTSAAIYGPITVDRLSLVWDGDTDVARFLMAATAEVGFTLSLDGIDPSISRSHFATLIKTSTDHDPALEKWRVDVFPSYKQVSVKAVAPVLMN